MTVGKTYILYGGRQTFTAPFDTSLVTFVALMYMLVGVNVLKHVYVCQCMFVMYVGVLCVCVRVRVCERESDRLRQTDVSVCVYVCVCCVMTVQNNITHDTLKCQYMHTIMSSTTAP